MQNHYQSLRIELVGTDDWLLLETEVFGPIPQIGSQILLGINSIGKETIEEIEKDEMWLAIDLKMSSPRFIVTDVVYNYLTFGNAPIGQIVTVLVEPYQVYLHRNK